jgi:type I restriction enzyme S subunit
MAAALSGHAEEGPLPSGWRWERLSSVCDKPARGTPASRFKQVFRYTDVGGVGEGVLAKEVKVTEAPSRARQFVTPGDTLLSCVRVNLRRVIFVEGDQTDVASTAFAVLRPRTEKVHPRYLYYWTQADPFVRALLPLQRGNQPPAVLDDDVRAQVIPVPPFETQRRIVTRIEELLSDLEDGDEELRRARAELETYRKSLLKAAVTGDLTADWRAANPPKESGAELLQRILRGRRARWEADPKNKGKRYKEPEGADAALNLPMPARWACAAVGQIGAVVTGATPATSRADFYGGDVPFFTPGDLEGDVVSTTKRTLTDAGRDSVRGVPAGSVLVTCIGATIGKLALAGTAGATNQQINAVVPSEALLSQWVHAFLSSPWGQHEIIERSSSTTMPILNKRDFSRVPVPLPPMAEIEQICAVLAQRLEERRELVTELHHLQNGPDTLRQSILSAAFRGELVQ